MRAGFRIGFFGGSFDPPHRGHLAAAGAAAQAFALDRVLFTPTGAQPLKPEGAVAAFTDRLAMVKICCVADARFQASALDAPRADGRPNYTVDALEALRRELGGGERLSAGERASGGNAIFVLVGVDAFLELRRWREPERLLAEAEWIVLTRPGFALADMDAMGLSPQQRARVQVLGGVYDPASATAVRARLERGLDCSDLLPAGVLDYIREHHLYGA